MCVSVLLHMMKRPPSSFDMWIDPVSAAWTIGDAAVAPHKRIKKPFNPAVNSKLSNAAQYDNGKGSAAGND